MARWERVVLGVVIGAVLLVGAIAVFGPEERLAFLFYDDAYYYLGVARHLAEGAGSTFDGLNPTNGYHPLWCWLLVPVFLIVDTPGAGLRVAAGLWYLLAAGAVAALWWAIRARTGAAGALIAAALLGLQPALGLGLARPNGLETPLLALLLALAMGVFDRVSPKGAAPRTSALGAVGLVTGAAALARLDALALVVAAAALLGLTEWRRDGAGAALRATACVLLVAGLLVGPSLAWNVVRFEHPLPVSGRTVSLYAERERAQAGGAFTSSWLRARARVAGIDLPIRLARTAVEDTSLETPIRRSGRNGAVALMAGFALLLGLGLAARRTARPGLDGLALLALFATAHFAVYASWLWTSGEERYRLYYFTPQVMLAAAAAGSALGPLVGRLCAGRTVLGASLFVALLAPLGWHLADGVRNGFRYAGGGPGVVAESHVYGWIRRSLPPAAVLGARDAGKLGYFAGRKVVNLDGLANDHRFLRALRDGTEDEVIATSEIQYLLFDRPWIGDFAPEKSPLVADSIRGPVSGSRGTERPSGGPTRLPILLERLHARPDCDLVTVPDSPGDWATFEIRRRIDGVDVVP